MHKLFFIYVMYKIDYLRSTGLEKYLLYFPIEAHICLHVVELILGFII